jgi:hypothetical protein
MLSSIMSSELAKKAILRALEIQLSVLDESKKKEYSKTEVLDMVHNWFNFTYNRVSNLSVIADLDEGLKKSLDAQ